MRVLVVYESMFGNTRAVARAIAEGARQADPEADVAATPVCDAPTDAGLATYDLLIVGGPTHTWSMSRPNTRRGAISAVQKEGTELRLEKDARPEFGVREWLQQARGSAAHVAAFDTRRQGPARLTGRASSAIARRLRRHSDDPAVRRESFVVDRHDRLVSGEKHRAQAWGYSLTREVWRRMVNAGAA